MTWRVNDRRGAFVPWVIRLPMHSAPVPINVGFTPNSRHVQCTRRCPLSANGGHSSIVIEAALVDQFDLTRTRLVEPGFKRALVDRVEVKRTRLDMSNALAHR